MANKELITFIKKARKRGFDDYKIREPLLKAGWARSDVEEAFVALRQEVEYTSKNKVEIYLSHELMKKMEQRAKKNMMTLPEQIEDILRRSTLNTKQKTPAEEKIDDKFITFFSRKKVKK